MTLWYAQVPDGPRTDDEPGPFERLPSVQFDADGIIIAPSITSDIARTVRDAMRWIIAENAAIERMDITRRRDRLENLTRYYRLLLQSIGYFITGNEQKFPRFEKIEKLLRIIDEQNQAHPQSPITIRQANVILENGTW